MGERRCVVMDGKTIKTYKYIRMVVIRLRLKMDVTLKATMSFLKYQFGRHRFGVFFFFFVSGH